MRSSRVRRVLVLALLLAACSPKVRERPFSLRIAAVGALAPLAPGVQNTFTMVVFGLVFPSIMEVQADGSLRSRILADWKPVGGGRLRVTLAPNVLFSDGTVAQLADLARSLRAVGLEVQPDGDALLVSQGRAGIAVDLKLTRTVLFRGEGVHAVGTGPFVVTSQSAEQIMLRRREPVSRRINQLELIAYPSQREAFAHTMRGDTNALVMLGPGELELFADDTRFRLVRGSGLHQEIILFNSHRLSREERTALAAAIDPGELARATGDSCPASGARPRTQPPPSGRPLEILEAPIGNSPRIALALKRALGKRGGGIETVDSPVIGARIRRGDFDLALMRMLDTPFALRAAYFRTGGPSNYQGYSDPAVDAALDSGDPAEIERALAADPPGVLVCRADRAAAIDSRVISPTLGPYEMLSTLPDWEVAP